ncbi:unnamed protein product [Prunus armeniaca]
MGSMGSDDPTADLEFSGRYWFLPLAAMEVTPWRRRRSFGGGSRSTKKREEKELKKREGKKEEGKRIK